jgi:hypothetical protein
MQQRLIPTNAACLNSMPSELNGAPDEQRGVGYAYQVVRRRLRSNSLLAVTTSPRTIAWLRANDSYTCPACNSDVVLDRDKQLAGLNEPTIR